MTLPVRVNPYRRKTPYTRRMATIRQTTLSGRKTGGIRQAHSPGKFEGEMLISELLHDEALGWGSGDELGDVQDFGHYQRIEVDADLADDLDKKHGLTEKEYNFIKDHAGVIINEDNYGFVYVTWYRTKKMLDKIWSGIEGDYEEFMEGAGEF